MITSQELSRIMPFASRANVEKYFSPLTDAMREFHIDTPARIAAFLAQVAHESGSLTYVRELASGAAYDVGAKAIALGNTPEDDDDGEKYRGRGLLQITGRTNYQLCGDFLGIDLIARPELLEQPVPACRSAGWFWDVFKNLNPAADRGDFLYITKKINGGVNGWTDRVECYDRAKGVLCLA